MGFSEVSAPLTAEAQALGPGMGVGSGPNRSKPVPPSPPAPSPSSASEAEVVERGVSPVANLPPNTASAGAEAPAAVIRSATFRSLQAASILPRRDGSWSSLASQSRATLVATEPRGTVAYTRSPNPLPPSGGSE